VMSAERIDAERVLRAVWAIFGCVSVECTPWTPFSEMENLAGSPLGAREELFLRPQLQRIKDPIFVFVTPLRWRIKVCCKKWNNGYM
jgi:hypothetical protein